MASGYMFIGIFSLVSGQLIQNYITYVEQKSCTSNKDFDQYFDSTEMACKDCSENKTVQKTSQDGLSCECQKGYKYIKRFGGSAVSCEKCGTNQIVSDDGWECKHGNVTLTCPPNNAQIRVERGLNGSWIAPFQDTLITCAADTIRNAECNRCVRCSDSISLGSNTCICSSPNPEKVGGFCFKPTDLITSTTTLHEIPRLDGTASTQSAYFENNLRAAYALCKVYKNATACQLIANMCVLTMYNARTERVCYYLKQLSTGVPYPNLFYTGNADDVINADDISDSYTLSPTMTIPFLAAVYSLEGKYLHTVPLTGSLLQLCNTDQTTADAAYIFGTYYSKSCSIKALSLFDTTQHPLEFYDIYLNYTSNGELRLYKIPIRFLDYRNEADQKINEGEMARWMIARRMFLVDNQISLSSADANSYVRYAKDIKITMTLQTDTSSGKIKIPYFTIKYGEISLQEAKDGASVQVSFTVTYTMSWSSYYRSFQIATGTLSTLSVLYACYRTWVWSKRAGRPAIDFPSLVNLIFFIAGYLSNMLFVIAFGISFYLFIFFKRQSVVYLLHPEGSEVEDLQGLIGSAFALRALSIIHMIVMQCSADIFLIDWERPRGISRAQDGKKNTEVPVSIWRTYFVANEWNELQSLRKINKVFQVFAVVFFLEVVGFVNTTTKDPDGRVNKPSDAYRAEESFIYRFALAVLVYITVAIVQWMFFTFLYERLVEDKVQQFVDLCSMSNISVFIMAHATYGYYIHGRSVHGKADTDMKEMCEMLKREEENLCGRRGLVPDTEGQTFMMSLPKRLRLKYEQVYMPAALESAGAVGRMEQGKTGSRLAGTPKEKSIEAYHTLNKFLCAFIDHSLRDVDYVVKDKTFLESILDTEFFDVIEKGIFYNDNGHSFDQVLFYGNEFSLILFDVLLFCIVDLIWMNYILDGVITYIIIEAISMIRNTAGRKNLARKTLVDERFLI